MVTMKPAGIARYVLHGSSEERSELVARNRKLISLRWIYQSIISGTAVIAGLSANLPARFIWAYLTITAVVYIINTILYAATRPSRASIRYYQAIACCQILLDLVIATIVTIVQGGEEARTAILFVIPIINAAMLFGSSRLVNAASILSMLGYSYALINVSFSRNNSLELGTMLLPILFYGMLFILIGRLLMYFHARGLGQTRDQAYNELLALLSHQLRHPASTISAIVDTIEFDKNLKYDKATARYVSILKKENDRQIHLINNLLEVVSPDSLNIQLQTTNITKVINEAIFSAGIAHKRTKDLSHSSGADDVSVHGSPEKIRMVFDNLIDNALRYSKKGTKVEVTTILSSTSVIITISDHGVGILPEHRRQLFKKFGNTAAFAGEIHGAGLGMYVSEKIMRTYGGSLAVKSSAGGGTQVTIKLRRIDND